MRLRFLLGLSAALLAAQARADVFAPSATPAQAAALPGQLSDADRLAYRQIFAALRAGDWAGAAAALDARPAGLLTSVARAQLYTVKGSPPVDAPALTALLAAAPDLPEAPTLARLARARGATALPALPATHDLVRVAGASKRLGARATRADAAAQRLAVQIQPLLKVNNAAAAEPLVEAAAATLTPEALTEWRQRVAWCYFQAGDDASARRLADLARSGPGEWAVQAAWVSGLAAWRAGDYAAAADAFASVGTNGGDAETLAAGQFWAARSDTAAGHPERVMARLRAASRHGETFYGLLATAALGITPAAPVLASADPDSLLRHPNLRAAAALVEIGETALADQLIRQQARIGSAAEHSALIAFAARIGLPETQVWLAQNAPAGAGSSLAARYPTPGWAPQGGWRVDRALLYAHALQESQFRADAVSRAGARGLMQLMPGTARLVARQRGDPPDAADRMNDPALNFEYGQSYLEQLARHAGTGGLLPKVIAAYNAGPNNVALWNLQPAVQGDPLLFIETIPFVETRAYVAIVLRNYWMYQRESGAPTPSLTALAQEQWPRFPGGSGGATVRIASANGATAN